MLPSPSLTLPLVRWTKRRVKYGEGSAFGFGFAFAFAFAVAFAVAVAVAAAFAAAAFAACTFAAAVEASPDWVCVTYDVGVVAHFFTPDKRETMDLEGLWKDAPRVAP